MCSIRTAKSLQRQFTVDPHPSRISSLDYLTVQILTRSGEPVGGARKVSVRNWGPKKHDHTVHLDKLNKIDFEDGWHVVRILPWTEKGEPVPVEEKFVQVGGERRKSHDSEPFYVLCEGEVVDHLSGQFPWPIAWSTRACSANFEL